MNWRVEFHPKAFTALQKLDRMAQVRISKFINQRIKNSADPKILGAPLKGKFAGLWKHRTGDYRLICHIDHAIFFVLIVNIGHRKSIYK